MKVANQSLDWKTHGVFQKKLEGRAVTTATSFRQPFGNLRCLRYTIVPFGRQINRINWTESEKNPDGFQSLSGTGLPNSPALSITDLLNWHLLSLPHVPEELSQQLKYNSKQKEVESCKLSTFFWQEGSNVDNLAMVRCQRGNCLTCLTHWWYKHTSSIDVCVYHQRQWELMLR